MPVPAAAEDSSGCAAHGYFIGGAGLYLIQPYFSTNPAYNIYRETKAGGLDTATSTRVDLTNSVQAAPLAWLGYVDASGLGARVRWWSFAQGTSQALALPTSTGPTETTLDSAAPLGTALFLNTDKGKSGTFAATSQLQLQVEDFEAFQQFSAGPLNFLLAGGVRLAHINQEYDAFVNQSLGGSIHHETLLSGHNFLGVGPVAALEVRRCLGKCGLGLYGSGRGSVLFGSAKQNALSSGSLGDPSPITVDSHWDPVLTVGELECGLEYNRVAGRARLFGQAALVGQEWFAAGNASRTAQGGVPTGFPINQVTTDSNLGFFGVVFRLGMDF
jgi:hypothetical protein